MSRVLAAFSAVGIILCCAAAASAQTAVAPPELVEVRVVNVEALVTDSEGKPVRGLGADAFTIVENGQPREISNFREVSSESDSGRRVVFFFDQTSLTPADRKSAIDAVVSSLLPTLGADDQMMVVTWTGSVNVRVPWTSDKDAIVAALEAASRESASSSTREAERSMVERQINDMVSDDATPGSAGAVPMDFDMLMSSARRHAEAVRNDTLRKLGALETTFQSLAGVDGRKVMVLMTEALPVQPGADLFHHLEQVRQTVAGRASGLGATASRSQPLSMIGSYDLAKTFSALGRAANAAGLTIYAVNPKPTDSGRRGSGTVEQTSHSEGTVDFALAMQGIDGLQLLSSATGGRAFVNAPPVGAFSTIATEIGSWYSLGYKARPGDNAERTIEVRSSQPGHQVRTRKSVVVRSMHQEMADRVVAHQLVLPSSNDLGISLVMDQPAHQSGSNLLQPLKIMIPIEQLTLVQSGGEVTGGFSVYSCTGDGEGSASGINLQSHAIRWPAAALQQVAGRSITFAVEVPVDRSRPQISVGVVDHVSQETGFARANLPNTGR